MKPTINKMVIKIALLFSPFYTFSQLPLKEGDAVVTHSPLNRVNSETRVVLRIIKTNNTSTASLGTNWNTSTMNPSGNKPPNRHYSNWVEEKLGAIFGITIDNNTIPNIYVSSSQIYSGTTTNASKIYRIDGSDGSHSLVYDFHNTQKSLGNLKYAKIGGVENIYVSNWDDGKIYRLVGSSSTTSPWITPSTTPFDPKFDNAGGQTNQLVYGIGIRNIGGNNRLYYARLNSTMPYGSNEIWSIDLTSNGDFGTDEKKADFTNIPFSFNLPIADIAFTSDGNKMLLGQQPWNGFGSLSAHNSEVKELSFDSGHKWKVSGNVFQSGWNSTSVATNAVGGVSYSNNVLQGNDTQLGCDSSVWFSSDYIWEYYSTPKKYNYGIQGMKSSNTSNVNISNSIIIDQDDENLSTDHDKYRLGDVEVFKKPQTCTSCSCGQWNPERIVNQMPIKAIGEIIPRFNNENITFECGKIPSAQWVDNYKCNGDCTDSVVAKIVQTGQEYTLPMNLSLLNQLKAGSYTIVFTPFCGTLRTPCDPATLNISIVCEPPTCCPDKQQLNAQIKNAVPFFYNTGEGKYNSARLTLNLNAQSAMSEIRISIEDFKLKADNPACLSCKNYPITWGSLLNANIDGAPMIKANGNTIGDGSLVSDNRELIYKPGSLIDVRNKELQFEIALPPLSEIDCCKIMAGFCVKVTFKDAECRECVRVICIDPFVMEKTKTSGGGDGNRLKPKTTIVNSNQ